MYTSLQAASSVNGGCFAMDVIAQQSLYTCSHMSILIFPAILYSGRAALKSFFDDFNSPLLPKVDEARANRLAGRQAVALSCYSLMVLPTGGCFLWTITNVRRSRELEEPWIVDLFGLTLFIFAPLYVHPLCVQATETLAEHSISYLGEMFKVWQDDLQRLSPDHDHSPHHLTKTSCSSEIDSSIMSGFALWRLTRSADAALGPCVFASFLLALANSVICFFSVVSSLFNHSKPLLVLAFACLSAVHTSRIWRLCQAGQRLSDAMRSSSELIRTMTARDYSELDREKMHKLRILRQRLDDDGPIKALAYFKLNKSTLLSIGATVATYMIILLQFKLQDISHK